MNNYLKMPFTFFNKKKYVAPNMNVQTEVFEIFSQNILTVINIIGDALNNIIINFIIFCRI